MVTTSNIIFALIYLVVIGLLRLIFKDPRFQLWKFLIAPVCLLGYFGYGVFLLAIILVPILSLTAADTTLGRRIEVRPWVSKFIEKVKQSKLIKILNK